ncbi:hypothetical protein BD769DRAFT_1384815 [Suillus cothurnatus]|nr:hypothetical protein BD769DRAFT_1384815 [Suillus cothurnatus]
MTAYQAIDVNHSHVKDSLGSVRLSYDSLMNLSLPDAVVRETLRLYPPIPVLGRRTTSATSVPLKSLVQSVSGEEVNTIPVAMRQSIVISILAAIIIKLSGAKMHRNGNPRDGSTLPKDDVPCRQSFLHVRRLSSEPESVLTIHLPNGGLKFAEIEIKDALATLVSDIHFALPSEVDENGHVKEIYWKATGFHVPVVKAPAGDGETPQLPLSLRLVRE